MGITWIILWPAGIKNHVEYACYAPLTLQVDLRVEAKEPMDELLRNECGVSIHDTRYATWLGEVVGSKVLTMGSQHGPLLVVWVLAMGS